MEINSYPDRIIDYYNQCHFDYHWIWKTDRNYSIHYGYYDTFHKNHNKAVLNMIRMTAEMVGINKDDYVLDAGCGVGGPAVWLALNKGCRVMAININDVQLEKGKKWAKACKVENLVQFQKQNYMSTPFPDKSFSVIWGLESICYAPSKKDFLNEAKRLLMDKGRIIVADGFLKRRPESQKESKYINMWLDGWAVPNLTTIEEFQGCLEELDFNNISFRDITDAIRPSSKRMFWATISIYPFAKLMHLVMLRDEIQMKNMKSAYYQKLALDAGLWGYGIFYADK